MMKVFWLWIDTLQGQQGAALAAARPAGKKARTSATSAGDPAALSAAQAGEQSRSGKKRAAPAEGTSVAVAPSLTRRLAVPPRPPPLVTPLDTALGSRTRTTAAARALRLALAALLEARATPKQALCCSRTISA
jgi:hypothetical protein